MFKRLSIMLLMGLAPLVRAETFTVGVEALDYYPYYRIGHGEYTGFARDLLDRFAASQGHHFVYRPYPVNRLFKHLVSGEIDFKFPDNELWKQQVKKRAQIRYSRALVASRQGFFVVPGRAGRSMLPLGHVAVVRGFTVWPLADDIASGKTHLTEVNELRPGLMLAATGRVHALFGERNVVAWQLQQMGKPLMLSLDQSLPLQEDGYKLSSARHPGLLAALDEWLDSHAAEVAALRKTYHIAEP